MKNSDSYSEEDFRRFLRIVSSQPSPVFDFIIKNFPNHSPINDLVYHYTSVDASKSIILEENLRLRCVSHMNDDNEVKYGVNLIEQCIRGIDKQKGIKLAFDIMWQRQKKDIYDLFITSLTEKRDDKKMWTDYGRGKEGICIGFRHSSIVNSPNIYYFPVTYDEDAIINLVNKALDITEYYFHSLTKKHPCLHFDACLEWIVLDFIIAVAGLPVFIKHKEPWEEESEHRIFYLHNDQTPDGVDDENMPFYNFNIKSPSFVHKKYGPFLPFSEIIYGVDVKSSDIKEIRELLNNKGYTDVPLLPSKAF